MVNLFTKAIILSGMILIMSLYRVHGFNVKGFTLYKNYGSSGSNEVDTSEFQIIQSKKVSLQECWVGHKLINA